MSISENGTFNSSEIQSEQKRVFGHHIGITMDIPFSEKLSLQPSVLYSTKGNKYNYSYSQNSLSFVSSFETSQEIKLSYLEIPIHLKLSFPVGKFKIFGAFGPYIAFGVAGSINFENSSNYNGNSYSYKNESDVNWGSPTSTNSNGFDITPNRDQTYLKRLDYGMGYGLGFEVSSLQIMASYNEGLLNIYSIDDNLPNNSVKNNVIRISVAYFIGKGKSKVKEEKSE